MSNTGVGNEVMSIGQAGPRYSKQISNLEWKNVSLERKLMFAKMWIVLLSLGVVELATLVVVYAIH